MLIKKWSKILRLKWEDQLGFWVWAALLSHIWRKTAADISHKAAGAGPRVPLWTGCCGRVSGADRLPDMKRPDWWWEAGWARWALQEISISRQRGIIVESNNKATSSVISETRGNGRVENTVFLALPLRKPESETKRGQCCTVQAFLLLF